MKRISFLLLILVVVAFFAIPMIGSAKNAYNGHIVYVEPYSPAYGSTYIFHVIVNGEYKTVRLAGVDYENTYYDEEINWILEDKLLWDADRVNIRIVGKDKKTGLALATITADGVNLAKRINSKAWKVKIDFKTIDKKMK